MVGSQLFAMVLVSVALFLLALAIWLYQYSKNYRFKEKVISHFQRILPHGATISGLPPGAQVTKWQRLHARASIYVGFELKEGHLVIIPLLFIGFGLLGGLAYGWLGAVLFFSAAVFVFGYLLPYNRLKHRQALVISQVPMLVDQILRSLSTGRSLESAIRFATEESPPPLRHILDRVLRATDLGADMVETLYEAAKLHGLRELHLIALAISISNSYGSSPKQMLESVVQMVRQQELARRELAAMTGETRISGWVLGMTPIAIALYIMLVNPNYMNLLLDDSAGKAVLIIAVGLQLVGGFILWRMMRSV